MHLMILDFDGVLADTFDHISRLIARYTFCSLDKARERLTLLTMHNSKESAPARVLKNFFLWRLNKLVHKHAINMFVERIEELQKVPLPKVILSNNYSLICHNILGQLSNTFVEIIGDDQFDTKVKGLEYIFTKYQIAPQDCIFITDTVGDILEIQDVLPVESIFAVDWGFHSRLELEKYIPYSRILSDFKRFY